MLVLCPNHHTQFDAGELSLRREAGQYILVSRLEAADVLHGRTIVPLHHLDEDSVDWHYRNWFIATRG